MRRGILRCAQNDGECGATLDARGSFALLQDDDAGWGQMRRTEGSFAPCPDRKSRKGAIFGTAKASGHYVQDDV